LSRGRRTEESIVTPDEFTSYLRDLPVEFVDLRWADLLGGWRQRTITARECAPEQFKAGFPVTLAGGRRITLVPDVATAYLDAFAQHTTAAVLCHVHDTHSSAAADDARAVARRAAALVGDNSALKGLELACHLEFFVFDEASFGQSTNAAHYLVDSREGVWRRGRTTPDNLGLEVPRGGGQAYQPPYDSLYNLRGEMAAALTSAGIRVAGHEHGPATGGHAAITLGPAPLLQAADNLLTAKYVIRSVAARHGKAATFMPKPLFGEHGSGLTIRLQFAAGEDPAAVNRWAAGGLLRHARSLVALTCPTVNSYRRLVPNTPAPLHVAWSRSEPQSAIRLAENGVVEFRAADPACHPHLAFSAVALAALQGIVGRIAPGDEYVAGGRAPRPELLPTSLGAALGVLAAEQEFLVSSGVFSTDLLTRWITHKLEHEVQPLHERPHPYEFCLYFDA
jgi:glutamine synthetase